MSRYSQLQQLLKQEDSNIEKLKFYPDHLLNLRSILAEWVEKQDWLGVLSLDGESLTCRSQELLQEALKLLQDKLKSGNTSAAGFEFHIHNIQTTLKKTYNSKPEKFVVELHSCLIQEEQLLSSKMSQEQAMCVDGMSTYPQVSLENLSKRVANCCKLNERIATVLNSAMFCLQHWSVEIKSKSEMQQDVFKNGKVIASPFSVFQKLKADLDQKSQVVVQELDSILTGLQGFITQWKSYELHKCVERQVDGEEPEMFEQVENLCEKVCACISTFLKCATSTQLQCMESLEIQNQTPSTSPSIPTPSVSSWLRLSLENILKKAVDMLLVVKVQPPLTMMIEKEKGQDKEDINNSKKFTTTVGILGGKGFEDSIIIRGVDIYLAYSRDLAEAQRLNKRPEKNFKIITDRSDSKCRHQSAGPDSPTLSYERKYEKLRVGHFSRREVKHVYKQLYHVVYDVDIYIQMFMTRYQTQTISLPIIVRTGANQAAEHIGAQLWHSFSSPNVYNLRGDMAPSMKVADVIKMMDERIKYIGGVGLRGREKEFLTERLNMVANGKGVKGSPDVIVTLDNFIKDKVCLPRHGAANGVKDAMDFSLWRWLHSIINLLVDPEVLGQPWVDEIIYGFASRNQCIDALTGTQDGTFLLRFSESFLPGNHIMAKGGLAAVIQRNGHPDFAPPITAEDIEKGGWAKIIANIGCMYLLGTEFTIADLAKKYPASKPAENSTTARYLGWCKQELIVPSDNGRHNGAAQVSSCQATVPKREQKKGKRSCQKTRASDSSSTKQYRVASPASPESVTSSVSSPLSMMSDERQQFQVVGVQEFHSQMSQNIPSTVYNHMPAVSAIPAMEQNMSFNTPTAIQPTIMVLERPQNGDITDISTATVSSPCIVTSSAAFVQSNGSLNGITASCLDDSNLQGKLNSDVFMGMVGDSMAYNLEELTDFLQNNISLPNE